jgi:Cell wall-active antibiotics response 4TMS YvqF
MTAPTLTPPVAPQRPPERARRAPAGRLLLGGLLIVLGFAWMLDVTGAFSLRWQAVLAGSLVVVGVTMIATARSSVSGGLGFLGVVLSVLVIINGTLPSVAPLAGTGDRSIRPESVSDLESEYEWGAGPLSLDLSAIRLEPGEERTVSASVGAGELSVLLPPDVTTTIDADSGVGEITILDRTRNGVGIDMSETVAGSEASGRLQLKLTVGMGAIEVDQ